VRLGNSSEAAGYVVWPVALLGGLVPNVGYPAFFYGATRRGRVFTALGVSDARCGIAMGTVWMAAFAIYGVSSVYLGALGTSAGWALFQIFMIMTANCSGLLTAEWKGAPPSAKYGMAAGLALLSTATALITSRS
jgi:L-rhamnose-H+ transport protein